jgi:hypothetical protein
MYITCIKIMTLINVLLYSPCKQGKLEIINNEMKYDRMNDLEVCRTNKIIGKFSWYSESQGKERGKKKGKESGHLLIYLIRTCIHNARMQE